MPLKSIKTWSYNNSLNKLLASGTKASVEEVQSNPARSFLFFFNGTRQEDVQFFRAQHNQFEAKGIRPKMLAFVSTNVDVHDFGMALYNQSNVRWNYLPKPKLIELVQSRDFDVLFNLNPENLPHLHYLAVAANAKFKISTPTELENNFNLLVKSKDPFSLPNLFREMVECLEKLKV